MRQCRAVVAGHPPSECIVGERQALDTLLGARGHGGPGGLPPVLFLVKASRMRACARDTASRLCVRTVFCRSTFSLVPPLRSTDSFAASAAPFASFPATMGRSDFSRPFIVGYGLRPSRRGPCNDPHGQPGDLPVPEQKDSAHAR